VRELISSFGLSYSQAWSEGYVLLRLAVKYEQTEVAKLLLRSGSKVNSNENHGT
jgi:ankyrin repeat protein